MREKQKSQNWTVMIQKVGEDVKFIYDSNVNRHMLIGLLEIELEILKKELIQQMCIENNKGV